MTSLTDLVRDVLDSVYSFTQVKDRVLYLNADINASVTTFVAHSTNAARQIQENQILQFSKDDSAQAEMVRVRSVDTTSNTVTIVRGVLGSTAAAWTSIDTEVRIEPEYPIPSIVREINKEIVGLPPHIWSYVTSTTTVDDSWRIGYVLPAAAVGIQSVQFLPAGAQDAWYPLRRYKFDPVNKALNIWGTLDPGQPLKIQYRAYPTALALDADTLTTAGLEDSLRELVVMGATYRLVMKRASGRLVDTRAETPLIATYRNADPVLSATRQLYMMYQERLKAERERQRLIYPSPLHYTI